MKPLVVLGSGGHAKMVIEAARSQGAFEPLISLTANPNGADNLLGVRVVQETSDVLERLRQAGYWAIVAVGENRIRRKLQTQLEQQNWPIATIVAATAYCSPSALVEPGTILMPHASVGAEARIGRGSIVNTNASIDHDCQIGDFVHLAPGSHLAGNVVLDDDVFCGVGVSVIPERTIGARTTIGAGGVVVCDVPRDSVWIGCPARPMHRSARAA